MTVSASQHLLKVTELLGRPGASRPLQLVLPVPSQLDLPLAQVQEPVRLDGVVESVVEGLLVRGVVTATMRLSCARCLEPIETTVATDVVELFADPATVTDPEVEVEDGYEIRDAHLDLDTLLRDALATAVPLQPLCRPACAGLCVVCGANRNEAPCSCHDDDKDPRWEALTLLRLPEDAG